MQSGPLYKKAGLLLVIQNNVYCFAIAEVRKIMKVLVHDENKDQAVQKNEKFFSTKYVYFSTYIFQCRCGTNAVDANTLINNLFI